MKNFWLVGALILWTVSSIFVIQGKMPDAAYSLAASALWYTAFVNAKNDERR
jgi:hypothetical protein